MSSVKQAIRRSLNRIGIELHGVQKDGTPRVIDISDDYTLPLKDVNAPN